MEQPTTTSPALSLDQGNAKKILKGFLINAGGAILTVIIISLFPQILEWAQGCVSDHATCGGINPNTAQYIILIVPFAATLVNTIKEWLTDYSQK